VRSRLGYVRFRGAACETRNETTKWAQAIAASRVAPPARFGYLPACGPPRQLTAGVRSSELQAHALAKQLQLSEQRRCAQLKGDLMAVSKRGYGGPTLATLSQ
jgi:hypothetical protein